MREDLIEVVLNLLDDFELERLKTLHDVVRSPLPFNHWLIKHVLGNYEHYAMGIYNADPHKYMAFIVPSLWHYNYESYTSCPKYSDKVICTFDKAVHQDLKGRTYRSCTDCQICPSLIYYEGKLKLKN